MLKLVDVEEKQKEICREILGTLPDWFVPKVVERVVAEAEQVPMIAAYEKDEPVAMITLKRQTPETIEIRALGVRPNHHRQGVGRHLINEVERRARVEGARMLSLKTVGPSDPNPNFVPTRAFYAAMGFIHVEELPLWGPETSCLLMVKALSSH